MKLTARQYGKLLMELFETEKVSELLAINFMKFLRKNRQERLLPRMLAAAEELWKVKNGIADVSVTSGKPLTKETMDDLKKTLEKRLAKNVQLHVSEDTREIGGIKLQINDTVYNNTVRRRLAALKTAILT